MTEPLPSFRPAPRTALVTGAAKRIGAAIATDLAAHGFAVAIHCRSSREEAEAVAAGIRAAGGRAAVVMGDLEDLDGLPRLLGDAAAALGPVGLLVNSASRFDADLVGDLEPAVFERQLRVNLTAPCLLAQALAAALPGDTEGHVVNITDQRVLKPTPRAFSYTLSKAALHVATTTLAQALAPRIRVNAIAPGPTLGNVRQSVEDFAEVLASVPLGRGPDLAEFGRTIRFLVETRSITGETICLDGGQHIAWQTPDALAGGE
jgi:NAD(P)-dependent dehydrogenase (short-subunit alcohol dehydrogenase family)